MVGTDFDFIHASDPSAYLCLESRGLDRREMPDKTQEAELIQPAFVFDAHFSDGTQIELAIDASFKTETRARAEALRYVPRLGKLPTALRRGVSRVVVHQGNRDSTAFSDVGLIVLYSDNASQRILTHDLEETVFHESVHATWDKPHARSEPWRKAQEEDGGFVTDYARKQPEGEDLAESALFAYTLVHHPERIPAEEAQRIRAAIPARIAFVERLLPRDEPIFFQVGPVHECGSESGPPSASGGQPEPPAMSKPELPESPKEGSPAGCTVDLNQVGQLSDVLSNALMQGLGENESRVQKFLDGARRKFPTAEALREAAAQEFRHSRETLDKQIEAFRHCNCQHDREPAVPDSEVTRKNTGQREIRENFNYLPIGG